MPGLLTLMFWGTVLAPKTAVSSTYVHIVASPLGKAVIQEARNVHVPVDVALAVCVVESGCNLRQPGPCWSCNHGNCGCMQVNYTVWRKHRLFRDRLRHRDALFGIPGVRVGIRILARLHKLYRKSYVFRYNGGGDPKYLQKVETHRRAFRKIMDTLGSES